MFLSNEYMEIKKEKRVGRFQSDPYKTYAKYIVKSKTM